jgi:cytoskeleton protein RodZ
VAQQPAAPAGDGSPPPAADTDAAARASALPPGPAASAARKMNEQLVRFRFAQASWVEIRDRDGRKIFSQFNPAGTEQVVSGVPPLTLVVGNAKGVGLTYNEQPVDLAPHTKVDVARLTLE